LLVEGRRSDRGGAPGRRSADRHASHRVIPTISPHLLPRLTPALRERYPKLTTLWIEDKTEALTRRLAGGELDAAILALEADIAFAS
jgi:DNA-binding transcriptional LysR family regulator